MSEIFDGKLRRNGQRERNTYNGEPIQETTIAPSNGTIADLLYDLHSQKWGPMVSHQEQLRDTCSHLVNMIEERCRLCLSAVTCDRLSWPYRELISPRYALLSYHSSSDLAEYTVWNRASKGHLKDTTLHAHLPLCDELCDTVDEQLFDNVRLNASHILRRLLPPESSASQNYSLVLVYIIYSYQIMLVISLTVTLLSECYLKTSTSILRRTIFACYLRTILPLFIHYYVCRLPTM